MIWLPAMDVRFGLNAESTPAGAIGRSERSPAILARAGFSVNEKGGVRRAGMKGATRTHGDWEANHCAFRGGRTMHRGWRWEAGIAFAGPDDHREQMAGPGP
jgi:hypothetical protein